MLTLNSRKVRSLSLLAVATVFVFLMILGISQAAEEILEGQPAPYGGALINDSELDKLLRDIQTLPIVEEERINLINQVNNLKDT